MAWKQNAAIAVTVIALGVGATTYINAPKTEEEFQKARLEQQLQDLSDSEDNNLKRIEDEADTLGDAIEKDKITPGEHRPPLPFFFRK